MKPVNPYKGFDLDEPIWQQGCNEGYAAGLKDARDIMALDAANCEATIIRLQNEVEQLTSEIVEITSECARFHKPA